jgi:hypothetical protein
VVTGTLASSRRARSTPNGSSEAPLWSLLSRRHSTTKRVTTVCGERAAATTLPHLRPPVSDDLRAEQQPDRPQGDQDMLRRNWASLFALGAVGGRTGCR